MDTHLTLNPELGEITCPKCEGTGDLDAGVFISKVCDKCQGKGKLDWCQQVVGVAPLKPMFAFDSSASMSFMSTPNGGNNKFYELYKDVTDQMGKAMALKIDEEILRSFDKHLEHNENKDEVMEDGVYDHRIFSELMLFPSFESKIKNQKD